MLRFIIRRVIVIIPMLFIVVSITWGLIRLAPGNFYTGEKKLAQLVNHFQLLHRYVPGLQANFIFGCDLDQGDAPVELTKEFMRRLQFDEKEATKQLFCLRKTTSSSLW